MKKIGVFGVNGVVGRLVLKELERAEVKAEVQHFGREDLPTPVDIAILCTDDKISETLASQLKDKAKFVIDMSARFRLDKDVPLVIPEINANTITKDSWLIASPNCTITGLVMALNPLKAKYNLQEVFMCSYQAISGGGKKLLEDFEQESSLYKANCVPQIGSLQENGYTSEELKCINETRKILALPNIKVRPHTVRVPALVGHSLGVSLRAKENFDIKEIPALIASQKGVVCDGKIYTPKEIAGKDEVFVSRIHLDSEDKNMLHMWITFDNLLKGAALNGRQIAQYLLEKMF
ncbi:MAG: aspartate-semialdehyde dehydrogenase [Elusimicrobiota bacterium]|jgi:aspartate-semialdehyde dehydrogenase|nr:aspartate-semialdehyde dehydrogenase [Elusimicrobiota bacterium]